MSISHSVRGVTLVELMITLAILAVVAGIAVPAYQSYVQNARTTEGYNNVSTLKVAEEEFFLENNKYFECVSAADCKTQSGSLWQVAETDPNFTYRVDLVGAGYKITAQGTNKVDPSVVIVHTKN